MRLLRVKVIEAATCGNLLKNLEVQFRPTSGSDALFSSFDPFCLVGPNGTGKSQFLQVIAEIFQSVLHHCARDEEGFEGNPNLLFELEYKLEMPNHGWVHVLLRRGEGEGVSVKRKSASGWEELALSDPATRDFLPKLIVGYTSGQNETLSLPFLQSRGEYAGKVAKRAFAETDANAETKVSESLAEPRLLMIDYGTHLEVLVASLLFSTPDKVRALFDEAEVDQLRSFRCLIQLAHGAVGKRSGSRRRGVQLTRELETYIEQLVRCATCSSYDEDSETYTIDYWVNEETRSAFKHYWPGGAFQLYTAFHKLAMLNDLALSAKARKRVRSPSRKFASRIPEPQEEDKVFRFESVKFSSTRSQEPVDYVSLSDGEHQLVQLLGMFSMLAEPGILFLLDEPESHFNPHWRVKFISRLLALPTPNGSRGVSKLAQDCILTTHAPFVPSDMPRDRVLVFSKEEDGRIRVRRPNQETFGSTFDAILEECFDVSPPIAQRSRDAIKHLLESSNPTEVEEGLARLGPSVERSLVAHRLRKLRKDEES